MSERQQGGERLSRKFAPWRIRRRIRKYSLGFLGIVLAVFCLYYELQVGSLSSHADGEFAGGNSHRRLEDPKDHFSMKQRRRGAVILHCIGLLYTFAAIAITCDEFFVPALEVITEVLELSPDVAGATFMAAGGSAPEFFTSLIGATVVKNDIGTGTIVGSAVFNVLFVIGTCALVAPEPLHLTWFPLARDSTFYVVDLCVVSIAFLDEQVIWYEAVVLFALYICYTIFMTQSARIEDWATSSQELDSTAPDDTAGALNGDAPKEQDKCWATPTSVEVNATVNTAFGVSENSDSKCSPDIECGGPSSQATSTYQRGNSAIERSGTRRVSGKGKDDAGEGRKQFRHKSIREHSNLTFINEIKKREDGSEGKVKRSRSWCEAGSSDIEAHSRTPSKSGAQVAPACDGTNGHGLPSEGGRKDDRPATAPNPPAAWTEVVPAHNDAASSSKPQTPDSKMVPGMEVNGNGEGTTEVAPENEAEAEAEEEEENEPLSIAPPGADASIKDWFMYLVCLPICFVLIISVPDVRRDGLRRYYVVSFMMSILWIAAWTWAMVWFATVIGETCGLKEHIMGLTVLAAGTSVPDLLTSVIVARQGHGDMAISSSIGSNIFDVTVGLPVPWLIYAAINNGEATEIQNEALEISVLLLLAMLGITIIAIVLHRWVMTRWMGGSMMFLYLIFEVISVALTAAPKGSLKLIHV